MSKGELMTVAYAEDLATRDDKIDSDEATHCARTSKNRPEHMLLVGCTVRLHSLIARPELNDRRGIVVKSTDPTTDRAGVQVEGEIAPLAVRSRNLVALVVEASVSVFATLDLFRVVLTHVPRRVRAEHGSAICGAGARLP